MIRAKQTGKKPPNAEKPEPAILGRGGMVTHLKVRAIPLKASRRAIGSAHCDRDVDPGHTCRVRAQGTRVTGTSEKRRSGTTRGGPSLTG